MATKATTPGLESIDRLEEKIKLLVNTIVRIKAEQVRALTTPEVVQRAVAQGYSARRAEELRQARQCAGVADPIDLIVIS